MIVYVIVQGERGDDFPGVLSVHESLEGAKAALIEWAKKYPYIYEHLINYATDDGEGIYTEEYILQIVKETLLP